MADASREGASLAFGVSRMCARKDVSGCADYPKRSDESWSFDRLLQLGGYVHASVREFILY
jgi:hypothetical protein